MVSEEEKVSARHHTGYLGVAASATFSLGIPAGVQTQFVIEGAFSRLLPQSEPMFRRHLKILDSIEDQILENMPNVAASKVGDIEVNPKAFSDFTKQYWWWVNSLCNLLGVSPNPYDQRRASWNGLSGSGVNVNVSG